MSFGGVAATWQKPVELICYALANSSKKGDIVLDLFGGSRSLLGRSWAGFL
jgi:hypothetical protein